MKETDSTTDTLGLLMRNAQKGDARAYAELLHRITPLVRAVVRNARGFAGREEVEDVVQEALLTLHTVRASYDASRPFEPWLMAIVRHRLADGARRHARTRGREKSIDDDVTFLEPTTNTNPETEVATGDEARRLHDAVQALPDNQRRAIELLKLQELSLKEAEAASGMSTGALKVATHRAVASLRRLLGTERS